MRRLGRVLDLADVAGHEETPAAAANRLDSILSPIASMAPRVGADEDDPRLGAAPGEAGVLGQEAEAGVDGLGAGLVAGVDDLVGDQVGLGRRRRADRHRLVGHLDGQAAGVGLGIDRDRGDAHPPRGLDDADRDLAAIGDQDLREHKGRARLPTAGRLRLIGNSPAWPD